MLRLTKWSRHLENEGQMVDESLFHPLFCILKASHFARHKVTLTRIKWGVLIWSKGPFTESTPSLSDQKLQNVKVLILSGREGRRRTAFGYSYTISQTWTQQPQAWRVFRGRTHFFSNHNDKMSLSDVSYCAYTWIKVIKLVIIIY